MYCFFVNNNDIHWSVVKRENDERTTEDCNERTRKELFPKH